MISIKRANEAFPQPLLFISITRSTGLEVVIWSKFLEPENIYSQILISGLESHIPEFSSLGLPHFLSSRDLSYNELEQLPSKAFYGNDGLEEL